MSTTQIPDPDLDLRLSAALPGATDARSSRPLLRHIVTSEEWQTLAALLPTRPWTLSALWGEPDQIHMAITDEDGACVVVSLPCPERHFPSVGQHHAPAIRLERAIHDMLGHVPVGAPDLRPWLDHGRWGIRTPLTSAEPVTADGQASYRFLEATGEALHQIAVGPVHAGIIEPGHFRFTASGEAIVRLEARLGYTHKGIEALTTGASIESAAQLAARTSGDSTVAFSCAFAMAVEQALGVVVPARAVWLRAVMAELERIANHLGDFGAICNDASFAMLHAHCGILRERVLRSSSTAFGHRLMMDCAIPGGMAVDLSAPGSASLRTTITEVRDRLPELIDLYENTASLQDRTAGTGILSGELARRFGAGGYVGRASGRTCDARKSWRYPPYDELEFQVPCLTAGDVDARVWIRLREITESISLIERMLDALPTGPIRVALPDRLEPTGSNTGEGLAMVEGFRGDILAWVRIDPRGRVARAHLRDPSWFLWPLLEAVVEGNIVADFPLCNKSFNCSYSGHDL